MFWVNGGGVMGENPHLDGFEGELKQTDHGKRLLASARTRRMLLSPIQRLCQESGFRNPRRLAREAKIPVSVARAVMNGATTFIDHLGCILAVLGYQIDVTFERIDKGEPVHSSGERE